MCARTGFLSRSHERGIAHGGALYLSNRRRSRGASVEDFKRRQEAAHGRIMLVTLAPEASGALSLIEYLVAQNICAAIGHTLADAQPIADAVSAGATLSTHLGNGCPQMMHRHENVIWNQLANDALAACLIA